MNDLGEEEKSVVQNELLQYTSTLRTLRSDLPGVPGESLMCPLLLTTSNKWKVNSGCKLRTNTTEGSYMFCHNDLEQHNAIVDPATLKIRAIIDWEFGGIWPKWFERAF
ncbi:hypothetical protein F5Y19DRAFT_262580 [Xylariaceae sp. FL1651]|nr:hypothetical protein F5Y19DRAFT_262580 [Xylariaceae sp. FL1651]